jgi:hypothetical protein
MDAADRHEELLNAHGAIVAEMPPNVRALYMALHGRMVKELGESSEAWRGAMAMSLEVIRCMGVGNNHDIASFTASERLILLVCSGLAASPYAKAALEGR